MISPIYLTNNYSNNFKRYRVSFIKDNKNYSILFGDKRYENYTIHKDDKRRENYIKRHEKNEDWTIQGITTAGFWSYWLLWNKPTLESSIKSVEKKFNIKIIYLYQ